MVCSVPGISLERRTSMSGAGVAAASRRKTARSSASAAGLGAGMLCDTGFRSRPPPAASKASGRGSPGCKPLPDNDQPWVLGYDTGFFYPYDD